MHVTAHPETTTRPSTITIAFNRLVVRAGDDYEAESLSRDRPLSRGWRSAFCAGFRAGYSGQDPIGAAEAFKAEPRHHPDGWRRIFDAGYGDGESAASKEEREHV